MPENYPVNRESINESVLAEFYNNFETKNRYHFLSSILKEGQSLDGLFLPYPVHIFKNEVQLVVSLVCQVLGLVDDCRVGDVILGFLLRINFLSSDSQSIPVFNLDEYLAEAIHMQLTEFPKVRFFRF